MARSPRLQRMNGRHGSALSGYTSRGDGGVVHKPFIPGRGSGTRPGMTIRGKADGRRSDNHCMRQLRSDPADHRRAGAGRGMRGNVSAALSRGDFLPRLPLPGIRRLRTFLQQLSAHGGGGNVRLCRDPGLRVAHLPPFRHVHSPRRRHRGANRPARQARRPARIPDHRGGVDARHAPAPIRRRAEGNPLAQRRPGGAGPARTHAAQADPRPRPQTDRRRPHAGRHAARRRTGRAVHGTRAIVLRPRRAPYRTPLPGHARPSLPTSSRPASFPSCT